MFSQKDPWTTALVIFVSLITVKIGIQNLEWGLKTARGAILQIESNFSR